MVGALRSCGMRRSARHGRRVELFHPGRQRLLNGFNGSSSKKGFTVKPPPEHGEKCVSRDGGIVLCVLSFELVRYATAILIVVAVRAEESPHLLLRLLHAKELYVDDEVVPLVVVIFCHHAGASCAAVALTGSDCQPSRKIVLEVGKPPTVLAKPRTSRSEFIRLLLPERQPGVVSHVSLARPFRSHSPAPESPTKPTVRVEGHWKLANFFDCW